VSRRRPGHSPWACQAGARPAGACSDQAPAGLGPAPGCAGPAPPGRVVGSTRKGPLGRRSTGSSPTGNARGRGRWDAATDCDPADPRHDCPLVRVETRLHRVVLAWSYRPPIATSCSAGRIERAGFTALGFSGCDVTLTSPWVRSGKTRREQAACLSVLSRVFRSRRVPPRLAAQNPVLRESWRVAGMLPRGAERGMLLLGIGISR
jgi:hypothetical protein